MNQGFHYIYKYLVHTCIIILFWQVTCKCIHAGLKVITGNDVKFCSYLISTVNLLYLVISMHVVLNSFTRLIITVINSNLREKRDWGKKSWGYMSNNLRTFMCLKKCSNNKLVLARVWKYSHMCTLSIC